MPRDPSPDRSDPKPVPLERLPPPAALRARLAPTDLELPAPQMRALGYQAVDAVVDHIAQLRARPAIRAATRAQMEHALREPLPRAGSDPQVLLRELVERVVPFGARTAHPGFFAYIPLSPNFPAIAADLVATGTSIFAGSWLGSPSAAQLELTVTDWFAGLVGLPDSAAGVLTSGGSMANLLGLACARQRHLGEGLARGRLYTSEQSHGAVRRAARVLGLPHSAVVSLPTDDQFRLCVSDVATAIAQDRAAGLQPFCVAATAGTTNTGAIDPLSELAALCAREQLWLHVDAAYGGFAAMTARGRERLAGLDHADSVVLDPHKWLHQPLECGCVLLREQADLEATFGEHADYLQDIPRQNREVSFFERGVELSRGARAVKVWLSLKTFGADRFAAVIDHALDLALYAAACVDTSDDLERVAPVPLSTVAFRYRPPQDAAPPASTARGTAQLGQSSEQRLDALQLAIVEALIQAEAPVFLTSTRLRGRVALRLCVLSHRTTADDVDLALSTVRRLGRQLWMAGYGHAR